MEATHKGLLEFMGRKNDFIIPVYQRNYDWTIENCKRLFNDIESIHKDKLKEYFMGAFTIVSDGCGDNELIVIDGQQRLTTLSLLLLAMYNLGRDGSKIDRDNPLREKILHEYLVDQYNRTDEKKRIKLKQVNQDSEAYQELFEINPKLDKTHNIHKNYEYLKKRILTFYKKDGQNIKTLYDILEKIKIVRILLKPNQDGDKPQLVFETINATGKKLSDADLIRNFILMDKANEEQKRIFETYWKPIEQYTRFPNSKGDGVEEKTTDFIWHFLNLERGYKLNKKYVYNDFKKYMKDLSKDKPELFLKKLTIYSSYYKQIAYGGGEHQKYYAVLRDILKQTTCYSYLLSLIDHYENHRDTFHDDMDEILKFIINYYIKRLICGEPTNKYNAFFPTVAKKIKEYEMENEENYIDAFYDTDIFGHVIGKTENEENYIGAFYRVFANDAPRLLEDEVLIHKVKGPKHNFYNQKCCKHILTKLTETKESLPKTITIEHIMPQNLTNEWCEMLGGGTVAEDTHSDYLHSLGNLTLTGYNSELKDKPFLEKLKLINENTNFLLNRYFQDRGIKTWNKIEIEKRTEYLAEKICKLLEPKVNLKDYLDRDFGKWHALEECLDILQFKKWLKPVCFVIGKKERDVKNWRDVLCRIADFCYKEDNQKMKGLIDDKLFFNNKLDKKKKYHEIAQDFYINVYHNAEYTMKHVKTILTEYGLADDFKVKMRMVGKE